MLNLMVRLDDGSRERERRGATGGLTLGSPWQNAVGVIVEARSQTLWTSVRVHDWHGPRGAAP